MDEDVCLFQKEIFNFTGFFRYAGLFQLGGGGYFYIYTLCTRGREACDGMQMGLELGGAYVAFSIWEGLRLWFLDQRGRVLLGVIGDLQAVFHIRTIKIEKSGDQWGGVVGDWVFRRILIVADAGSCTPAKP
ncbi:hypothetical protein AOQ84DRAFT_65999 [Glonium stellatum]|uniref:Uncharacterized protein n=1 Tax=Glonium stellatum TaxID=574774 RepID=A0A8E2JRT4_9PEZI|nr:hypothetical protein AOQ84DRAFT_65999 [Glonium stellatum]